MISFDQISARFQSIQDTISAGLEKLDGKVHFREDRWTRLEGGGGITRVMQEGGLFEKAGVNFSSVHGLLPEKVATRFGCPTGARFQACGVSLVIHPENPHLPIVHMNIRFFEVAGGSAWFGGGTDLTPIYIVPDDAVYFHRTLKSCCDRHDPAFYEKFKLWCDNYFFLKHRNETRGIGGIFFDRLTAISEAEREKHFSFAADVGETFLPLYSEIVRRHAHDPWNETEKQWQLLRRSRYVEFNLLFDAGTQFGIDTGGRTESILMSMPPLARWEYDYHPEEGTPEADTLKWLRPVDWLSAEHELLTQQKH